MQKIDVNLLREEAKSLTVLYVEDELSLRVNMDKTLARLFNKVLTAKDGQEALDVFKKEHVDLIITDINMPVMNGIELIENIVKNDTYPPIIVLTAHNENDYLIKLINLGINYFLNKPIEKDTMVSVLYKVCRSVNDHKMVDEYRLKLEIALIESERKNRVLATKLKQYIIEKNAVANTELPSKIKDDKAQTASVVIEPEEKISQLDKDELKEVSIEIDSYITMLFRNDKFDNEYVIKLSNAYKNYARALSNYNCFEDVASAMKHLGDSIMENEGSIHKSQDIFATFLESFHFSLEVFRNNLENRSVALCFYNPSLLSDIESIVRLLTNNMTKCEIELF